MSDDSGMPPGEAYGRVTNPERYRCLHPAADALLERLAEIYAVEREEGLALDEDLAARTTVERVVRLKPSSEAAGPLTVAITAFPGLAVRFGVWHVEALPRCGCDACDEQPDDLVRDLEICVADLVAGRFSEALSEGRLAHRFGDRRKGWTAVVTTELARLGPAGHHDWAPWPRT